MKESIFVSEVKKACDVNNYYYYKIPDSFGMQRFSPPKPFDSFILNNGIFYGLEFKMVQKKSAFPFSSVREHQIENLLKVEKNNGIGLLIINYRFKNKDNKRINEVFILDIDSFLIIKEDIGKERKSIPYSLLKEMSIKMKKIKINNKSYWDIKSLINHYKTYVEF